MMTFLAAMQPNDGYGIAAGHIAHHLRLLAPDVRIIDFSREQVGGPWKIKGSVVAMFNPFWLPYLEADQVILYTMFEGTQLPEGWAASINMRVDECIVPCRWCADVFAANGVRTPIRVVKLGVDTSDYPLMDRRDHDAPYTFLWTGTPDYRKGWDIAYQAFFAAFGWREDVRLIIHMRQPMPFPMKFRDPNVEPLVGQLSQSEWLALLRRADCFVFPSRGEGWGLPPREAAATGLPVLVTRWSGTAEDVDRWGIPIEVGNFAPAQFGFYDGVGQWAEPDQVQLAECMKWCVEHTQEAADIGRDAAAWLAHHATWRATAHELMSHAIVRRAL